MSLSVGRKMGELLLNTPKRKQLLKDGPPVPTRCQILGRGAYGTVFKAIYRDRSVAVKIIRAQAASTLHNESHLQNLEHRNIVRLLKLESAADFGLVIMECPRGQCLQRIVDTIALPLVHRIVITLDVVAALRYCHSQNVLHLDVKPTNILVDLGTRSSGVGNAHTFKRSYICKLCDFGSSMEMGEFGGRQHPIRANGTLRYMSPEVLRSDFLSEASDIYSLGITMWQLQARKLPYHALDCNETIAYQVVKHELRPDSYHQLKILALDSPSDCNYVGENIYKRTNSSGRRNLSLDPSYTAGSDLKKKRRQNRLALHFDCPAPEASACLENAYSKLYKSCWVSAPESRLSSFQLKHELELILGRTTTSSTISTT
ncbi:proto-oncogene serine/threonine-protein kinase mos isoform X1 [Drosophila elegans]|uniref:proto-oncogene serine/threonine-protein kinase mos isoform X1 n=2 Tax=Drosophila elegans TaxID=30023 RepID=UPI0007E7EE5D|nr:proto-oncogene serine/threonine-protein kinase mos isoform X1 [Drosophila elegans]